MPPLLPPLLHRLQTPAQPSKRTSIPGLWALVIASKPRLRVAFFLCVTLLCRSGFLAVMVRQQTIGHRREGVAPTVCGGFIVPP